MSTQAPVQRAEISASALGMILFIASEVMFFAALFGAYFTIRAGAESWPPEGADLEIWLPAVATGILVASSATVHFAVVAAERGRRDRVSRWLLVTIGLGLAFLGAQGFEYSQLAFSLADHSYGTLFYSMTGFHALHVSAGVVTLALMWMRNARGTGPAASPGPTVAAGLYWHFVDVVWVLLFATLYLLR